MLTLSNVTKRYADKVAVDRVSFEVHPGRILGLLGPNGAGKTSTIRMIAYITAPDEGEIRFDGRVVGAWSQRKMGYLPEERGLYRKMRVGDQLQYLARLKGLSRSDAASAAARWLDRFDAADWHDKKVEELSKGMQQKIQFIATVIHDPELLIFDEPFSGLDPINADLLQEVIFELKDGGRTILFASHRMEQVEQLCDDICLISNGRILVDGKLREVKAAHGRNVVAMEFDGDASFLDGLQESGHIRLINRTMHRAELRLVDGTTSRSVLETAMKELDTIYRFELVEPSLNEIFISVVSNNGGERAGHLRTASKVA
ncbi:MAG: ATP-binding cassette domain-containing protein [Rhodothermales bacterium]|nr:ATP-binding cassette domain-containing protein [Rhodothermales bacterium]